MFNRYISGTKTTTTEMHVAWIYIFDQWENGKLVEIIYFFLIKTNLMKYIGWLRLYTKLPLMEIGCSLKFYILLRSQLPIRARSKIMLVMEQLDLELENFLYNYISNIIEK